MITPRLQSILDMSDKAAVTADIGTDHAYIPIELVRSGMSEKAIASDIKEGPLEIAHRNISEAGLENKIETRLGAGLSVVAPGEADQIIIAGMGGEMIESIIKDDIKTARASRLLLQPMNSQYELRRFLIENSFRITGEDIAIEGFKVYNIIAAESGSQEPFKRDIDYHLPPYLKGHPLYGQLLAKKRREFEKIISGLERSKAPDNERLEKYRGLLKEMIKS